MRSDIEALFQTNNLAELKKLNYYELFSVDKALSNADLTREINSKFRQLALRFHPDQTNGENATRCARACVICATQKNGQT